MLQFGEIMLRLSPSLNSQIGLSISIPVKSFQTVEPTSIVEAVDPHSEPIRLSYHGGEHYNSVTTDPDSTWKLLGCLALQS